MIEKLLARFGYVPEVQDQSDQVRAAERALATSRAEVRAERDARIAAERSVAVLQRELGSVQAELRRRVRLDPAEDEALKLVRLNAMRERSEAFV